MFLPILSSPQDLSCKVNKNDYLLIYASIHTTKKEGKDENKKILDNMDNYLSNLEISSQQALCALLKGD